MLRYVNKFEPWQNIVFESSTVNDEKYTIVYKSLMKDALTKYGSYDFEDRYNKSRFPNGFVIGTMSLFEKDEFVVSFEIRIWWHNLYKSFYIVPRKLDGKYELVKYKQDLHYAYEQLEKYVKGVEVTLE